MPRQNPLTHGVKKHLYLTSKKVKDAVEVASRTLKAKSFDYDNYELEYHSVKDLPFPTDWSRFKKYDQLYVEIGCGHGELIAALSQSEPQDMFVGFEVTKRYTKMANSRLKNQDNAIVLKGDGFENTLRLFSPGSITKINILFPDPWHKKKHNKRRPVNSDWLKEISTNLIDGGEIFFATDWIDYYEFVLEHLAEIPGVYDVTEGDYDPEEFGYPKTHYYKKWLRLEREFKFIRMVKK